MFSAEDNWILFKWRNLQFSTHGGEEVVDNGIGASECVRSACSGDGSYRKIKNEEADVRSSG